ncbi:MAG TPA: type II toxin-antitoxin system HicA family toxin [Candidatus Brocadiia bacterium]|nr:type II toxin-antitoxin system HicA family toxin [Candidatus Brocadiia bacterium]
MPRLPVLSGAEAASAFERAGWRPDRQRGSHLILLKPGHVASLSVPQHRELAPGTLRAFGMSVEEFSDLL